MTKSATPKGKKAGQALDAAMADFLVQNVTASGPKGKSAGVPEVTGHAKLADKVHRAYKEAKDAEAAFRLVEGELLEVTDAEYEKRSKAGDHTKSMNLPGTETGGVQVVYQDKFSALSIEQEPGLKDALGADVYATMFEQARELKVKKKHTDAAGIKLLREKLGDELFLSIFEIKVTVVAKPDMDKKQFDIPEAVRTLCGLKQAKAGVKALTGEE
jgi:hypothetical protein